MIKLSLGKDVGKKEHHGSCPVNWFHVSQEPSGSENLTLFDLVNPTSGTHPQEITQENTTRLSAEVVVIIKIESKPDDKQ